MTPQCLYFSYKNEDGGYCYLLRNNIGMGYDKEKYKNYYFGHRNSAGNNV